MTIYNSTTINGANTNNGYQPVTNNYQSNASASSQTKMSQSAAPLSGIADSGSSPISSILRAIADALGASGLFSQAPQLTQSQSKNPYIRQAIPTDPAAAQLKAGGQANLFNQNWQALVADAAAKNGGFGNAQDGFLGYSESGFVRHYNPNLSEQQNKRLAEISLESGFTLEQLPARSKTSGDNVAQWVDKFIQDYDTQMASFAQDPSKGVSVKDGRRRFEMKADPASGQVLSSEYKKRGGFAGFIERNFKYIEPIANGISYVASLFPGVGTAIAAVAQGVKQAATMVVNGGKLTWQGVVGIASSVMSLMPGAATVTTAAGTTATTTAAASTAAAGTAAVSGSTVLSGLANAAMRGLQNVIPSTGWETLDSLITRGLEYGISQTDKSNPNSFSFMDFIDKLFSKPEEAKPATPAATQPNNTINADDPMLEGTGQSIPGTTVIA